MGEVEGKGGDLAGRQICLNGTDMKPIARKKDCIRPFHLLLSDRDPLKSLRKEGLACFSCT